MYHSGLSDSRPITLVLLVSAPQHVCTPLVQCLCLLQASLQQILV